MPPSVRPQPTGGKVVVMLALQELKKRIKEPKGNGKSPTARYLMEHEKAVLKMDIRGEAQLWVFGNGYALYKVGKHTTVFPVHGCGDCSGQAFL